MASQVKILLVKVCSNALQVLTGPSPDSCYFFLLQGEFLQRNWLWNGYKIDINELVVDERSII